MEGLTPLSYRRYRKILDDIPDQYLFFGSFLVGALAIVILKLLDYRQMVVTVVPLSIMFLYAGLASLTKKYRIREDRIGDNLYYLGFLYTLVSLAYALWAYRAGRSAVEAILTNFGIALATTIVGLALRVFFNQMREDPVEYGREAQFSLAEAAREMKGQLDDISIEMSAFKRKLAQVVEEGVVDINQKSSTAIADNLNRFNDLAEKVLSGFESIFGEFKSNASALNEVASKNVAALKRLFTRIDSIEFSPDLLTSRIDSVFKQLSSTVLHSAEASKASVESLKVLVEDASNALGTNFQRMKEETSAVSEHFKRLATSTTVTNEELIALHTKALAFSETLTGLETRCSEITSTLTLGVKAINDAVKASLEQLDGRVAEAVDAEDTALAQVKQSLENDLKVIREIKGQIAAEAQHASAMVLEVERSLVSLANGLAEKINGPTNH